MTAWIDEALLAAPGHKERIALRRLDARLTSTLGAVSADSLARAWQCLFDALVFRSQRAGDEDEGEEGDDFDDVKVADIAVREYMVCFRIIVCVFCSAWYCVT